MNIHELEVFASAYEAGSFAAAAEASFVTRQAASKIVSQLEHELGPLFVRGARGIEPTELARKIYPTACRMLRDRDQIVSDARAFADGQLGSLTLAVEPGAMLTLPPRLIDLYREARPQVTLSTELLPTPVARRHLLDGRADAVVSGPLSIDGAEYASLFTSGLAIVFSTRHFGPQQILEGRPAPGGALTLPLKALNGATILGVNPNNHVEQALLPYLAKRNITAKLTFDYGDSMLGQSEMMRGTGGIIVEERAAWQQFDHAGMVLVPLVGDDAPRWMAGVSFLPTCKNPATARDFALFSAAVASQRENSSMEPDGARINQ